MRKLRRVRLERREEIYRKIDLYTREVVERLQPYAVVLFGSFATEDIHEGSDVDIAVIADFGESFLDRITLLMELNRWKLPLEPIGYTPQEVAEMKARGNPFIEEVLTKGRVLYQQQKP